MAKMRTGCNGKRRRAPIEGGARASRRIFALAVSVLLACAATALAPAFGGAAGSAVPEEMSFQGYLTVDGVPLEGTALVGFAIYAAETGGAALWTQAESEIEVAEGLYTAVLRSLGGLSFDAACWLEVTVDGEPLAPRYPLLSVPYALRASLAERVAPGGVDGAAVLDGSLTAADIATPIVSSISGVTHHGGDIALVAGDNVTIVPDAAGQTITISAADGAGGDVTDVIGGAGLTAIDSQGPRVTLAVGAGPGIAVSAEAVGLDAPYLAGSAFDARFVNENQAGSITTAMIVPNVVSSISGVTNDGGNITLRAGENVAIAPDNTTNTITISASHDGGDVTDVFGGDGIIAVQSGGPQVTLSVGAGDGIAVSVGEVSVRAGAGLALAAGEVVLDEAHATGSAYDDRFVNAGEEASITAAMLVPTVVGSIAGVAHHAGDIDLVAGDNVVITPDPLTHSIRIAATGDVTDVFAGPGLTTTTSGGPQVTLEVYAGDGLEALEDGLHVNAAALVGNGLRHDGQNNLAVRAGDGLEALESGLNVVVSDLVGDGLTHDGENNLAVRAGDGLEALGDGLNVVVSDLVGDGLTHDGENNLAVATATGLEIVKGMVQLTEEYSSGSAYDDRFVNEGGPSTVPIGGIIMWSGASVPENWALCNGQTAYGVTTPDLRNRFVLAAGGSYSIGSTGGASTHTLTIDEMPSHNHGVTDPGHTHAYTSPLIGDYPGLDHDENGSAVEYPYHNWGTTSSSTTGISIQSRGGGQAHNNMPPYYALAFIMRVR